MLFRIINAERRLQGNAILSEDPRKRSEDLGRVPRGSGVSGRVHPFVPAASKLRSKLSHRKHQTGLRHTCPKFDADGISHQACRWSGGYRTKIPPSRNVVWLCAGHRQFRRARSLDYYLPTIRRWPIADIPSDSTPIFCAFGGRDSLICRYPVGLQAPFISWYGVIACAITTEGGMQRFCQSTSFWVFSPSLRNFWLLRVLPGKHAAIDELYKRVGVSNPRTPGLTREKPKTTLHRLGLIGISCRPRAATRIMNHLDRVAGVEPRFTYTIGCILLGSWTLDPGIQECRLLAHNLARQAKSHDLTYHTTPAAIAAAVEPTTNMALLIPGLRPSLTNFRKCS